jgi:hypothetical protein
VGQNRIYRIVAVSPTPNLSLNTAPSAATVNWSAINSRVGGPSLPGSSTTLTVDAGTGGAISTSFPWNYHIRIHGSINDWLENSGCNVNFRASLVFRQN